MDALLLEGTADTPTIVLDPANDTFEISGRSYPEDTLEFYTPLLQWIETYVSSPNSETKFVFKLQYFNSSSYKPIFDILSQLENINKMDAVTTVEWYYKDGDWDMKEAGEEFAEIVKVPFSFHTF